MQMAMRVQVPATLWTRAHVQATWRGCEIDALVSQALREYLEHAEQHRRDVRQTVERVHRAHQQRKVRGLEG